MNPYRIAPTTVVHNRAQRREAIKAWRKIGELWGRAMEEIAWGIPSWRARQPWYKRLWRLMTHG